MLVLLRFGTFPFEEKAICGVTSGQRWMVPTIRHFEYRRGEGPGDEVAK